MSDGSEEPVLLVGVSTRTLADAALISGYRPRTVDFYGDLDQRTRVANVALGRDLGLAWSAATAARVASSISSAQVAYGADLENAPAAVELLARGRELLGNPPAVLRAVRDPVRLFGALAEAGVPTPPTVFPRGNRIAGSPAPASGTAWLRKPLRGGGGRDIALVERSRAGGGRGPEPCRERAGSRRGDAGRAGGPSPSKRPPERLPRRRPHPGEMLQELLPGPVVGFAFLADRREVRPLALSLQLEDRREFGAAGFAYVGSVSAAPPGSSETQLREQALKAARVATRCFGLRGLIGMDFVARNGEVVPLEINPRHTASMELWDGPDARLFAAHVAACRGTLSGEWLPRPPRVRGKAILYARRTVVAGDVTLAARAVGAERSRSAAAWPPAPVADLPHPGERIARGQPVCTLLAEAGSMEACVAALRALARAAESELAVETELEDA